jgi:hypothetical protein
MNMSIEAVDHHRKAAEHFEYAAKHHTETGRNVQSSRCAFVNSSQLVTLVDRWAIGSDLRRDSHNRFTPAFLEEDGDPPAKMHECSL